MRHTALPRRLSAAFAWALLAVWVVPWVLLCVWKGLR